MKRVLAVLLLVVSLPAPANPVVIAHRGASGYLPEHTLEAAALAYAMGSDYIEQDLVLSKDGVPVVLHDIHLDNVTNVTNIYPDRKRADGRYYVIDFDLAELKTLKVYERRQLSGEQIYPDRYQGEGQFTIATFEEHIELVQNLNRQIGRNVGLYPEIKAPAWHRKEGYDFSKIVLSIILEHDLDRPNAKLYLQCFDFNEIKRISKEFEPEFPLVQLIGLRSNTTDYKYLRTEAGVQEMKQYVQGVGPAMHQLIDLDTSPPSASKFAGYLTKYGLEVHPNTHREDRLPAGVSSDTLLRAMFKSGATGVFTDFPDVVNRYLQQ